MFQNISGQADSYNEYEESAYHDSKIKIFLKNAFTKQKIAIYIISFMISTIKGINGITPFAISIFAAVLSNKIPALIVYVLTLIGTFIGLGGSQTLNYLLTSLVFVVMTLIFKPKQSVVEYENEKLKLGKYVFLSSFLVQVSSLFFKELMVYDILVSIMVSISAYIFYKIFANSLIVINEFAIKKAFAIEEVIGASILLAICASSFRDFSIFNFEIRTILSILIVLVLGWKNGVLVGATSGITIGTILGLINGTEPITIASYAISGMIAGIFSRFGRIGVIVGFILGNGIFTFVTNGNTQTIIYLQEILIASLGLLLVPKNISIDIEDLVGKEKLLPTGPASRIEENKETVFKLNNVSETIAEIADTYKEAAATIIEEEDIEEEKNRKIFIDELSNNLEGLEENILYDDLQTTEDSILIQDIFKALIKNGEITRKELLDILANHNNYIIGFDNVDVSMELEKDIKDVVQTINQSFKMSKVNFIWKQKMDENKRNIGTQLNGVSKVISSLADDIEQKIQQEDKNEFIIEKEEIISIAKEKKINIQDINIRREKTGRYIITVYLDSCCDVNEKRGCTIEQMERILSKVLEEKIVIQKSGCGFKRETNLCVNTYASEDKYMLQLGISQKTKEGSPISGDSKLSIKLDDGKYLLAISDGMGTGPKAKQASGIAIKMLQRLLASGFDKDTSIELINSTLSINTEEDTFATLDIAILDLYSGNIEFIKNGACPTYIKEKKDVQIIKALSLPAGILENINLVVYDKDIEDNDILVMCSDGIMESNTEYQNKELWVRDILQSIQTDNVQKIADIITKEAIDNGYGVAKDDMTIIVAKFIKR